MLLMKHYLFTFNLLFRSPDAHRIQEQKHPQPSSLAAASTDDEKKSSSVVQFKEVHREKAFEFKNRKVYN